MWPDIRPMAPFFDKRLLSFDKSFEGVFVEFFPALV